MSHIHDTAQIGHLHVSQMSHGVKKARCKSHITGYCDICPCRWRVKSWQ